MKYLLQVEIPDGNQPSVEPNQQTSLQIGPPIKNEPLNLNQTTAMSQFDVCSVVNGDESLVIDTSALQSSSIHRNMTRDEVISGTK